MDPKPNQLLSSAITNEMAKRGLSRITEAARAIGVGKRDLRHVINRIRTPNKRTFGKYATFLNVSQATIEAMVDWNTKDKTVFFYGDEVDAAVRAIQDVAVQRVVGNIRPELVRAISKLDHEAQKLVLQFVDNLANRLAVPALEPIPPKRGARGQVAKAGMAQAASGRSSEPRSQTTQAPSHLRGSHAAKAQAAKGSKRKK